MEKMFYSFETCEYDRGDDPPAHLIAEEKHYGPRKDRLEDQAKMFDKNCLNKGKRV